MDVSGSVLYCGMPSIFSLIVKILRSKNSAKLFASSSLDLWTGHASSGGLDVREFTS